MRIFIYSSAIILSLLLSHTAVQAQDKLDEFQAFRNKLNTSKHAPAVTSPDDEEEEDENTPQALPLGAASSLPTSSAVIVEDDASTMMAKAKGYQDSNDPVSALQWYKLARAELANRMRLGNSNPVDDEMLTAAIRRITKLNLDMSASDKEKAEQLFRSWRPGVVTSQDSSIDAFEGMVMADSKVSAVTVYNNRAKVTRVAEVTIPAGAQTIAFKDMPALLLGDSLRAEGSSKATVKFGALTHKKIMFGKPVNPREREQRERIEKLRDQITVIELESEGLAARKEFLDNGKAAFVAGIIQQSTTREPEKQPQVNLKPQDWIAASQTLQDNIYGLQKSTMENTWKIRDINKEINRITQEISRFATGQTSTYAVMVPVESDISTKLTIELSYQIPNATWKPIYDARLSSEGKGGLELTQYGAVHQVTGEDWKGVALTLSTAQPQRGTTLPDLNPMWLDAYESRTGESAMPIPIGRPNEDALSIPPAQKAEAGDPLQEWRSKAEVRRLSLPAEQPEKKVSFTPAQIETGGFMTEYKITGPSTVLSDGTETKLLVGNFEAESKIQIQIKPQISTDAYLVAHTTLKGESPILPGQVNLFRDGAFTGQSQLPLLRPGEEHEISFGIDDQVSVKRKTLKNESKEEGMISKDKIVERVYVTEIQNLHSSPVTVVVKETTPAPRNEKIHVSLQKQLTAPGFKEDVDNIKGLLTWEFEMQPKDKKELKLGWAVNWPKDHTLSGLQ